MKISKIHARQVLDSRGNPTIETDVILENGAMGRAIVPSGASTGIHEALELRDNNSKIYNGKSVFKAVENVNIKINNALLGKDATQQEEIDKIMIELDGTENKSKLGANAILSVSIGVTKAAAISKNIPLFAYFGELANNPDSSLLPLPMMNIINGGKHANWAADLQEYLIFPVGASTFSDALRMGTEVFHALGSVLKDKGYNISVGDEGGYAPFVKHGNTEPFDLISEAVEKAGYKIGEDIVFGLDGAASEFFSEGKYHLKAEGKTFSTDEMIDWLSGIVNKYPIVSLEDCLDQEDWEGWNKLTKKLGDKIQIVGDDLLVTNLEFLKKGISTNAANAILIKLNQIGTVTETLDAITTAHKNNWHAIVSHRSGETEDTTIAHLSVGLSTGQIKTGSLSRTDRVAKYNELLRIEEKLGEKAIFAGRKALNK